METNYTAFQCPDFGRAQMDNVRFGKPASGFAFNGYELSRASGIAWLPPTWAAQASPDPATRRFRDVAQMTETIAFADSAQVKFVTFSPPTFSFEENWILAAPKRNFPNVHFRHNDSANVAFLDGHVKSFGRQFFIQVPGPNFVSQAQADLMEEHRLGYATDGDPDNPGKFYDRK
jgi:prepilin-type processing-associated H-X9-DG protein